MPLIALDLVRRKVEKQLKEQKGVEVGEAKRSTHTEDS